MSDIPLGRLIESEAHRDAIHVAIFPAVAHERLHPGQHVGLAVLGNTEQVGPSSEPVGIVDPFLTHPVSQGERCYVCLYPLTVTGMRHHWEHPAFQEQQPPVGKGLNPIIQKVAEECGLSYSRMMESALSYAEYGEWTHMGENEDYKCVSDWTAFWTEFEKVSGKVIEDKETVPFSCSC